jgi:hypothetical protein
MLPSKLDAAGAGGCQAGFDEVDGASQGIEVP